MPIKDPEKRKEYNKNYHKKWYADGENKTRRKRQAIENQKISRNRNYAFLFKFKEKHGCESCSERRPQCLDFHHHEGEKENNLSRMANNACSLETLIEEIKKCKVLCKNCHANLHFEKDNIGKKGTRNWGR